MYAADGFSRIVPPSYSWGEPEIGSDPWEVTFGGSDLDLWSVENGTAKARTTPVASSGQRVPAARDVEMRTRFSVNALTKSSSISTGFLARFRRIGGPTGDHVRMRVRAKAGRLLISVSRVVGGVATSTEERDAGPASPNVWFWMKFKVVGDTIQGKLWRNREVQPDWLGHHEAPHDRGDGARGRRHPNHPHPRPDAPDHLLRRLQGFRAVLSREPEQSSLSASTVARDRRRCPAARSVVVSGITGGTCVVCSDRAEPRHLRGSP